MKVKLLAPLLLVTLSTLPAAPEPATLALLQQKIENKESQKQ
jgi:hypothetical protein